VADVKLEVDVAAADGSGDGVGSDDAAAELPGLEPGDAPLFHRGLSLWDGDRTCDD
jgi:hypothetical protein